LTKKQRKELAKQKKAEEEAAKKQEQTKKVEQPKKTEEAKPQTPSKQEKKAEEKTPAKRVISGGLEIEDVVVGQGVPVKNGQKVSMRYIGKLTNGKVFDSNTKGQPFKFTLGKGQVIKGWDLGIAGMKVGGERKLTIPAKLAYGAQGAPPEIPKNATLMFDVKLLAVNNK
jgi:FK506-binding nuclear protein